MHPVAVRSAEPIDLANVFRAKSSSERIGIELEYGLVRSSGDGIGYDEPRGIRVLLESLLAESSGEPVMEDGNLLAVKFPDGAKVSLEPGGAIEYSSAPYESVAQVTSAAGAAVDHLTELGRNLDIALLPGGLLPFTKVSEINWIPKGRVQVMRDYFKTLGDSGSDADGVMGLATSAQTTLDYTSEEDLATKLRVLVAISPIVAALFVNSPLEGGELTGALSRRLQLWRKLAPPRCGVLEFAVGRNPTVNDIIEWVARLPMTYRSVDGHHVGAPDVPFTRLLTDGFGDGSFVTDADWESQLSQVWPHVRVRRTIELRIADGLPWHYFGAVPALWAGVAYDAESQHEALKLVNGWTWAELETLTDDVAVRGLAAKIGGESVGDVAGEVVRLSRRGLAARVDAGKEPPATLDLLDPLAEVVASGRTFAECCVEQWLGAIGKSRDKYVAYYRI
jgi:glutamate--cysteine ligase